MMWKKTLKQQMQEDIQITLEDIQFGVRRMANWKAAGPDYIQGFWFERMTNLHPRLQNFFQK